MDGKTVATPNQNLKVRLSDEAFIQTAEVSAIFHVLSRIEKEMDTIWVIFLDSLRNLQAVKSSYLRSNPILTLIQDKSAKPAEANVIQLK
jgi:hypothetical protein